MVESERTRVLYRRVNMFYIPLLSVMERRGGVRPPPSFAGGLPSSRKRRALIKHIFFRARKILGNSQFVLSLYARLQDKSRTFQEHYVNHVVYCNYCLLRSQCRNGLFRRQRLRILICQSGRRGRACTTMYVGDV